MDTHKKDETLEETVNVRFKESIEIVLPDSMTGGIKVIASVEFPVYRTPVEFIELTTWAAFEDIPMRFFVDGGEMPYKEYPNRKEMAHEIIKWLGDNERYLENLYSLLVMYANGVLPNFNNHCDEDCGGCDGDCDCDSYREDRCSTCECTGDCDDCNCEECEADCDNCPCDGDCDNCACRDYTPDNEEGFAPVGNPNEPRIYGSGCVDKQDCSKCEEYDECVCLLREPRNETNK